MTSARHAADSRLAAVTYAGPEWMGKANWHSVAETYLFKALGKPGLYALTRLMLAVNRRFPDVLLNRRYDGLERLMGGFQAFRERARSGFSCRTAPRNGHGTSRTNRRPAHRVTRRWSSISMGRHSSPWASTAIGRW